MPDLRTTPDVPADPFAPAARLLVKLGSLAVHVDELLDPHSDTAVAMLNNAAEKDAAAIQGLLADPEVRAWLGAMGKGGLLPLKRSGR